MSRYDDLFDEATAGDSVFAEKSALDPLAEPEEVIPRTEQEQQLARILAGVTEGYLPLEGFNKPEFRKMPSNSLSQH